MSMTAIQRDWFLYSLWAILSDIRFDQTREKIGISLIKIGIFPLLRLFLFLITACTFLCVDMCMSVRAHVEARRECWIP